MEHLRLLIENPAAAILAAKRAKKIKTTIETLVLAWILIALGAFAIPAAVGGLAVIGGGAIAVSLFILGLLFCGFVGYLLEHIMTALGGRGSFFEGLTAITYALWPLSLGFLISAILSFVPVFGGLIAFIVTAIFGVIAIAVLYRATKELFAVDIITALIGIGVLAAGLVMAGWAAAFFAIPGGLPLITAIKAAVPGFAPLQQLLATIPGLAIFFA
jgi:hypothetical protein